MDSYRIVKKGDQIRVEKLVKRCFFFWGWVGVVPEPPSLSRAGYMPLTKFHSVQEAEVYVRGLIEKKRAESKGWQVYKTFNTGLNDIVCPDTPMPKVKRPVPSPPPPKKKTYEPCNPDAEIVEMSMHCPVLRGCYDLYKTRALGYVGMLEMMVLEQTKRKLLVEGELVNELESRIVET